MHEEQQLTFDHHRLDLASEQLWCGSKEIPLPGKAFAMLRYLLEHAGQLVSKAELFAALWPGTAVTDGALTFCIVELRKALGDNAKAPRFIETVHRRGYRFIAPLTTSQPPPSQKSKVKSQKSAPTPSTQYPTPTLVGRETELAQLHQWSAKALSGERQIIFVTGEPGIGKTTLIEAFLAGVRGQGSGNNGPAPTDPRPLVCQGPVHRAVRPRRTVHADPGGIRTTGSRA
ncbi:MAG: winged helix-turn-helix domain-containing protein [Deltaproteobacteria bacterium]|nr:winged helix-turn-helix domain-containing protein [Deltaproteobacteria bacterium]